ncbi:MAG: cytochrome C oxidase subunit IV family protein, partial [Sandaracinaceae bacterium]|nr:cytochrome C oxidase subunit IV family protein [Sandaracinaceae bacterium]
MADPKHEHEHPDDGAVHVHIHSTKFYAAVFGGLILLTIITVATSYVDLDHILALGRPVTGVGAWNLGLAVLIATVKASLVILFFMHLKDDSRFNAIVFVGAVLFIGVFFAYTLNDTALRGTLDRYNGVHVDPDTGLRAPGGIPAPIHGE